MNDPKPGYQTTEFYITLAGMAVAFAMLQGWIGKESADHIVESVKQIAEVVAFVGLGGGYAIARGMAKSGK